MVSPEFEYVHRNYYDIILIIFFITLISVAFDRSVR